MGCSTYCEHLRDCTHLYKNADLCPGLPEHPSCRIPGLLSFSTTIQLNWNLWEMEGSHGKLEVCRESRVHLIPLWFFSSSAQIHQRHRSWAPGAAGAGAGRSLLAAPGDSSLSAAESGQGWTRGCCSPAGFNQQLQSPPAPWAVPRCTQKPRTNTQAGRSHSMDPCLSWSLFPSSESKCSFLSLVCRP